LLSAVGTEQLAIKLQRDLQKVLLEVVEFWAKAQRHQQKVMAVGRPKTGVTAWQVCDRYGQLSKDTKLGVPVAMPCPQL
jgi:hypothetical protein